MRKIEKVLSVHDYGQLGAKLVDEQNDAAEDEDFAIVGGKIVGIPPRKMSEDVLAARSVVVDFAPCVVAPPVVVLQSSAVNPPTSWLEFTVANTANLPEDKIVAWLPFPGIFDSRKFGFILLLPNGHQIAIQLVNGISGDCLLKSIGESPTFAEFFERIKFFKPGEVLTRELTAIEDFMDILFEDFSEDTTEGLTVEEIEGNLREAPGLFPQDLPPEKVDEWVTVLAQETRDILLNKDRLNKMQDEQRSIVDLILSKLPPPNEGNQVYWDSLRKTIGHVIARDAASKEEVVKLKERYPAFSFGLLGLEEEAFLEE
ncbi:MAG: hypothetical protein LBE98_03165 [Puniceicoccales bacterium]|jgi:hypothetical protein|nr:hypothetical protein [Puniceicoccales bacterium]